MQVIPLETVPNQEASARLGGLRYTLRLRDIGGVMAVDVTRGDTPIVRGIRAVAGTPLLPYRYLEAGEGNFIFLPADDAPGLIPYWPDFGTRMRLIYATQAELDAIA